jgi:hypothetical protein
MPRGRPTQCQLSLTWQEHAHAYGETPQPHGGAKKLSAGEAI